MPTQPISLLSAIQDLVTDLGCESQLLPPTAEMPLESLEVRFTDLQGGRDVIVELTFVPLDPEVTAAGVQLLQFFASLAIDISPADSTKILRTIARINCQLPLGAFGLVEKTGLVYLKHIAVLDTTLDQAVNLRLVDRQLGLFLHEVDVWMGEVLEV